jgi:serine protease inhibitor
VRSSLDRVAALALALVVAACAGGPVASTPSGSAPATAPVTATASPTTTSTASVAPSASAPAGIVLARSDLARATVPAADASLAGSAIEAFGLDLYRQLAEPGRNLVISPASAALALAMARAGARGQTASQMDAVLRSLGSDASADWLNALDVALASRTGTFPNLGDPAGPELPVTLQIANAAFGQLGLQIEQAYLDALATRYGTGVDQVDYVRDPEAARQLINGWVASQTADRITQLLVEGDVTNLTRMVLVDAVYLKAPWARPFDPSSTKDGSFTLTDGSTISVPMMHLGPGDSVLAGVAAAGGAGWVAVELPYLGGQLSMTIIVPTDLATLRSSLGPGTLDGILAALATRRVDLTMPRFQIDTRGDLADALRALGMTVPFSDTADFSGITQQEPIKIGAVIQQADIAVDEKGTEATAATAVVMAGLAGPNTPPPPLVVRVDRPFLFLLRDVPTGTILFMGQVVDPSSGS